MANVRYVTGHSNTVMVSMAILEIGHWRRNEYRSGIERGSTNWILNAN
jgi:hypothetical protein